MLTRWNDYYGWSDDDRRLDRMADLRRQMDHLLEGMGSVRMGYDTGAPRTQLADTGSQYQVRMEVPGFTQQDLQIELEKQTLTVRGKRTVNAPEGYSAHRRERTPMQFARSFTLPGRVDPEKVTAKMHDGVLELALAKAAEEQPRRIHVNA